MVECIVRHYGSGHGGVKVVLILLYTHFGGCSHHVRGQLYVKDFLRKKISKVIINKKIYHMRCVRCVLCPAVFKVVC